MSHLPQHRGTGSCPVPQSLFFASRRARMRNWTLRLAFNFSLERLCFLVLRASRSSSSAAAFQHSAGNASSASSEMACAPTAASF